MGTLLDKPEIDKTTECEAGKNGLEFGASAMQGWRVEMEDAHTIVSSCEGLEGHSFVAVYDGHAGSLCAEYAGTHMMRHITDTADYKAYAESTVKDTKKLESALYDAFLAADRSVKVEQDARKNHSGCTAVVAFITPTHVVMAHAGDSRAVLASGGKVALATEDHKPYNPAEEERIQKAGGCVSMKRVDGDLAVSRALGDFQYKDEALPPEECKVTAAPDTKSILRIPSEDEFLIVACDGIWDVMSDQDCTQAVREIFLEGENNVGLVCEEILDMCLIKGSRDNMSSVLVTFPALKKSKAGDGVRGRRAQRAADDSESNADSAGDGEGTAAEAGTARESS